MAQIYNKFNSFVEALAEKKHNLGSDTLKVALCASANAPVAGNVVLADLVEIDYTYLLPVNRTLSQTGSEQTGGTYKLSIADLPISADGGTVETFRYIAIYNDSATNKELVGYYDYGMDVSLNDQDNFILNFDDINGVLTLV